MRHLLRGIIIKSWKGTNFETSEYRKYNKILIKKSVMFYKECQFDRCNEMYDEEDQKKLLNQWHGNFLDETMNGDREARRHAERTKLDVDRTQNKNI